MTLEELKEKYKERNLKYIDKECERVFVSFFTKDYPFVIRLELRILSGEYRVVLGRKSITINEDEVEDYSEVDKTMETFYLDLMKYYTDNVFVVNFISDSISSVNSVYDVSTVDKLKGFLNKLWLLEKAQFGSLGNTEPPTVDKVENIDNLSDTMKKLLIAEESRQQGLLDKFNLEKDERKAYDLAKKGDLTAIYHLFFNVGKNYGYNMELDTLCTL